MTTTVNIHDAKTHFSKLLQRVFNGEEVIIAKAGEPVAILSPLPSQMSRRVPGNDAGKVTITPVIRGIAAGVRRSMKALLDTQVFLWWNMNDSRLSQTARDLIADGRNELYLTRGQRLGNRHQGHAWILDSARAAGTICTQPNAPPSPIGLAYPIPPCLTGI